MKGERLPRGASPGRSHPPGLNEAGEMSKDNCESCGTTVQLVEVATHDGYPRTVCGTCAAKQLLAASDAAEEVRAERESAAMKAAETVRDARIARLEAQIRSLGEEPVK